MPDIFVQQIAGSRRSVALDENATVPDLRRIVARELGTSRERLRLVFKGVTLQDGGNEAPALKDGDTLLAFVAPTFPAPASFGQHHDCDDDGEDERFRLRLNATRFERAAARQLQRWGVPDVILSLIFAIKLRVYIRVLLWFLGAPIAARYSLGPPYVLLTLLLLILTNLGTRQQGELSAYSVFNTDVRALPGTLNADTLDAQIRQGQM